GWHKWIVERIIRTLLSLLSLVTASAIAAITTLATAAIAGAIVAGVIGVKIILKRIIVKVVPWWVIAPRLAAVPKVSEVVFCQAVEVIGGWEAIGVILAKARTWSARAESTTAASVTVAVTASITITVATVAEG